MLMKNKRTRKITVTIRNLLILLLKVLLNNLIYVIIISEHTFARRIKDAFIEELTNYCDINYRRNCSIQNCGYCDVLCSHPTNCPQNCEQCLEQIHFPSRHPNGRIDYTCNNVLNFYICKYFHKYASEIEYALQLYK